MVRWYEIQVYPGTTPSPSLVQTGNVSDPNLYIFNGAVSDDRQATGATSGLYGADAVIGVTTSSLTHYPAVQMVAKVTGAAQSPLTMVHQSPGPDNGFDCIQPTQLLTLTCRWGDYSGASPDPASPTTDTVGRVWLSNMDSAHGTILPNLTATEWGTFNWEARP
jgi:hypothetical protein